MTTESRSPAEPDVVKATEAKETPYGENWDVSLDVLDAIRLALVGSANERVAVAAIRKILAEAPRGDPTATRPTRMLVRAIQETGRGKRCRGET